MSHEDSIGALWKRKDKKGRTYLTGVVNGMKVVIFANDKGDNEKRPDFRVYKSREQGERHEESDPFEEF